MVLPGNDNRESWCVGVDGKECNMPFILPDGVCGPWVLRDLAKYAFHGFLSNTAVVVFGGA
ncbi:hypothetical protein D9M73_216460 [compost metagenome]